VKYYIFILLTIVLVFRLLTTKPTYNNGDKVRVTTTVYSDPIKYETSQYLVVAGLKIYLPLVPEITYGDKLVVEGIVDGDKLKDPKLIDVSDTKNFTSNLRKRIIDFYKSSLPDPYSGLLAGITLGSKGTLTQEFWEKVKKTGVAHVVVASGTNITFVTAFMVSFLSAFLPRRKMIPLVILSILLYLFISGFDAPLIRAAVMGTIAFIAQKSGRLASTWRIFIITALLMLIVSPSWITDLGFILSFVATASLMLFEKRVRDRLHKVPEFFKESLSTSLAAQIGVTPILFVTFGGFNILSPVINALVLWTIPGIMIIGALGGVIGVFIPFLGKLILYLGYPLLWWFNTIVTLFSF
jgi:competence protein ComEC